MLKRGLKGTYVSVEPFHLFRYPDEQASRYSNRKTVDGIRFREALKNVAGRRLTYKELTGKNTRSLFYRPSQGRGRRGKLRLVEDRAKSEKPKELSPYERFREFARRIITVPKSEIAEKEAEYQRGRESEKAMRKAQRE